MSFYQAKAQFQENFRLLAPEELEKRNLYGGLLNLVEGMEKLQRDVTDLREELRRAR